MSNWSVVPWKPATTTTLPRPSSSMMRCGTMSTIRALRWTLLVRIPAWGPVSEIAGTPSRSSAMAMRGAVMVSPVERSWSISRSGGAGLTLWARLISSSVLLPMALTTTTTRPRSDRVAAIRRATRWISSALATPTTADGAYAHFLADYQSVWKTTTILPTTFNEYDSIVIASLAMTMAKSTDPKVWVKDVTAVADPPGVVCGTYATCVKLIKQHKQINYNGASGSDDFNKFHNRSEEHTS